MYGKHILNAKSGISYHNYSVMMVLAVIVAEYSIIPKIFIFPRDCPLFYYPSLAPQTRTFGATTAFKPLTPGPAFCNHTLLIPHTFRFTLQAKMS